MLPQRNRRRLLLAASADLLCGRAPIARSANDAQRWIVAIGGCGGSGRDPAQAAFDLATRFDLISRTLAEAAEVFILAGIGGGTGYGATLALAGQLSQREVAIEVIAVTPFVFEQPVSNVGMRIETLRRSARVKAMSPVVSSTDEAVDRALLRCQHLVSVACMNWIKR